MENTCNRCHQAVQLEDCYCPACGLPQLVYAADSDAVETQPEVWEKAVRDAGTLDWKPALRSALLMAIPAGLLSSEATPTGRFGLLWMATAAGQLAGLRRQRRRIVRGALHLPPGQSD